MMSDLLAILLAKLREEYLVTAAGRESYLEFRDLILTQTSRILFSRRRGCGGLHRVDYQPVPGAAQDIDSSDGGLDDLMAAAQSDTREDLLAAVQGVQGRNVRRPPPRAPSRPLEKPAPEAGARTARKCANGGKEHAEI